MSLKSTSAAAGLVKLVTSDPFSKSMRGAGVGGWFEVVEVVMMDMVEVDVVWEAVLCDSASAMDTVEASAMDTVEASAATCVVAVNSVWREEGGGRNNGES